MLHLRFVLVFGIVCFIVGDLGLSIGDANSWGHVSKRFEDAVDLHKDHSVTRKRLLGKNDHLLLFDASALPGKRKRIACPKDSADGYKSVLRPLNNRHWRRNIMKNTENMKYIRTKEKMDSLFEEQSKILPDNEVDDNDFAQQLIRKTPDIDSKKTQRYTPSENTEILFEITKRLLNNGNLTEDIRNVNSEVNTEKDNFQTHRNPITTDNDHMYLVKINPETDDSLEEQYREQQHQQQIEQQRQQMQQEQQQIQQQQQAQRRKQKQKEERQRKLLSSLSRLGDGLVFIDSASGQESPKVTQRPQTQKQKASSSGPVHSIVNFGNTIMDRIGLGRYDKPIPPMAGMKPNTRPQIGKVALGSNMNSLLHFENDENLNNNENYGNERDCAVPFLTEDLSENSLDYVTSKNCDNNA